MSAHGLGDPALHFWLTRSVGRVMGVSFTEAISRDRLSAKDYAEMVTTCRGCDQVANCQLWLSRQTEITKTAPPNCRNKDVLQALARPH